MQHDEFLRKHLTEIGVAVQLDRAAVTELYDRLRSDAGGVLYLTRELFCFIKTEEA